MPRGLHIDNIIGRGTLRDRGLTRVQQLSIHSLVLLTVQAGLGSQVTSNSMKELLDQTIVYQSLAKHHHQIDAALGRTLSALAVEMNLNTETCKLLLHQIAHEVASHQPVTTLAFEGSSAARCRSFEQWISTTIIGPVMNRKDKILASLSLTFRTGLLRSLGPVQQPLQQIVEVQPTAPSVFLLDTMWQVEPSVSLDAFSSSLLGHIQARRRLKALYALIQYANELDSFSDVRAFSEWHNLVLKLFNRAKTHVELKAMKVQDVIDIAADEENALDIWSRSSAAWNRLPPLRFECREIQIPKLEFGNHKFIQRSSRDHHGTISAPMNPRPTGECP